MRTDYAADVVDLAACTVAGGVPDLDKHAVGCHRSQHAAISGERQMDCRFLQAGQEQGFLLRCQIPELHTLVVSSDGDQLATPSKGHAFRFVYLEHSPS